MPHRRQPGKAPSTAPATAERPAAPAGRLRVTLPDSLLVELRARRERRADDPFEREHDAHCLDVGLGTAWYLTLDGRILGNGSDWDECPVTEATYVQACQAIVVGADRTGIAQLLDLLPARPEGALRCRTCWGRRFTRIVPASPDSPRMVCVACNGLGWSVFAGQAIDAER